MSNRLSDIPANPPFPEIRPLTGHLSTIGAAGKLTLFVIWTFILAPSQMVVLMLHTGHAAYVLPQIWQWGVCKIFGIRASIHGAPHTGPSVLYVSNHISYLDIPLIGGLIRASFVAKRDVRSWPVWGFLSRLQQTAFISRARHDATQERNTLSSMLAEGKSLILFPEGTSTEGTTVLPFKSSLFAIALQGDQADSITIQPITVRMSTVDGRAVDGPETGNLYAWPREMTTPLHIHLWRFAKTRGAHMDVFFHPCVSARIRA